MKTGKGRATLYKISPIYKVFSPLNNTLGYFDQDPDTRNAQTHFNHEVISLLGSADLFNAAEKKHLESLKHEYQNNISDYPPALIWGFICQLFSEINYHSTNMVNFTLLIIDLKTY